ncbi:MAG: NAD(P)H-dependent oxidoreductase subunit E [Planctomycetaceae bacterium]|nr:NAD(P)H-dependent oxidoreductase subunit E [Planctomycetaceae bacterium]
MTRFPAAPIAQDADVLALREQYGETPSAIIEVLKALKNKEEGLSPRIICQVAYAYKVPEHQVSGMASFYSLLSTGGTEDQTLRLCDGVVCEMAGAEEVRQHCRHLAQETEWEIVPHSCLGLCDVAPAALHGDRQLGKLSTNSSSLEELLAGTQTRPTALPTARSGETRFLLRRPTSHPESDGQPPDPDFLDNMMQRGPQAVLDLLEQAEIRGLGGAGYPTSLKWSQVAGLESEQKYVVCNADESEPLSVKDRTLIDSDPFRLLEGMLIAGWTVGATQGIIYIRGEYEPQARRLESTIRAMRSEGRLNRKVGDTEFSFEIELHRGAGAYICGEETALLESLEGRRGEPRPRPPYPVSQGLHQLPTLVNNVETLCTVAALCQYGLEEYQKIQTEALFGTKIYAVFGAVNNPGVFEAPRGLTLGELIDEFGGGLQPESEFSFALVGGAAGQFVNAEQWKHRLDFSHSEGTIPLGTGGILVADTSRSVPATLRDLLRFFERESCGQCVPCRVGTHEIRLILDRLLSGDGTKSDLRRLEEYGDSLSLSLCGLGTSVPSPLQSALERFRPQFESLL